MAVEIFTYSNGDVAKQIMNAIATLFKSDGFASMISICALFAIVATAFHFFIKRDHNHIVKWAAVYFAVPLLAINTTTSVQITDLSDPTGNYRVDNVPAIVAYPAAWSSHYMHAATTTVEDVFHTVDDEQYSKTGMMFGAKLYRLSRQSGIENTQLKSYWQHYISSCIQGDILLNGKYTWKEFANAPDIWGFLASHSPSPLRAIQMGYDDYPTCREALPRLKAMFQADSAKNLNMLGSWIYGDKATSQQAFLNTSLSNGYQRYANISQSASQITLQNMTINAVRDGLADNAAISGNTAAAFNYAYTQNKMQTTSMWAGMALQAREFLPMLQSILFLLFSSVAFLVIAIAMIPQFTFLVLGNYVKGFIYLGTWPVMFALINFIMTTRLSLNATALTDIYGGITLSNVDPLQEMHSRYAAMTGFLMMSVPVLIVPLIMKGGAAVMSSMSHQFAGMMNSANARTSASAASGDINLGNAQVDTYSYNNTHANKLDTTGSERIYGNTVQDANGYETTTFDSGKEVISGQHALSRALPVSVSGQETVSNSLSQIGSDYMSASKVSGESFNESITSANNSAFSLMIGSNHASSYGSNSSVSDSGSHNKGFSDMYQTVKSYAQDFNKTEDQAFTELASVYAQGGVEGKIGTPGAGMFGSGVSASTSAGVKGSSDESDSTRLSDSERDGLAQSYLEQFSNNMNTIKSFSTGEQTSDINSQTQAESQNFMESMNQAQTHAKNQQAQLTEAQNYTEAANRVESGAVSVNRDFNQDFVNFAIDKYGNDDYKAIIAGETKETQGLRTQLMQEFIESDDVKAIAAQYVNNDLPQSPADIARTKQEYADAIDENKQQTNDYMPFMNHTLDENAGHIPQHIYDQSEQNRIAGLAAQGVQEIREDTWAEEPSHTPSQVPTIDKAQALADAEAKHALVPEIEPQVGSAMSEEAKMDKAVRDSSPFGSGPKM